MVVPLIKFKCCINCGFGFVCHVPGDSDTIKKSSDEVSRCRLRTVRYRAADAEIVEPA